MKILIEYPPNIEKIRATFKLHKGIVFTYGKTLYNPDEGHVDAPLLAHEMVHAMQQGDEIEEWWDRYLADPDFRFAQELPAYQTQYQTCQALSKDRNRLHKEAVRLARDLSSEMYGQCCTAGEALTAIKKKELYTFHT
jgi:hypothetical protein